MLRRPSPSALRLVAAMALGLALLAGLTVLSARLWVEWQWFEQFDKGQVLLHRWLLRLFSCFPTLQPRRLCRQHLH